MGDQYITALVHEFDGKCWALTVVYASSKPLIREKLWLYIQQLGKVIGIMWVLIGDINQPLDSWDKRGGRPINRKMADKFWSTIDLCQMLDIGFQGSSYTWCNRRDKRANIQERIDRAWCNLLWNNLHDDTIIRHLTRVASDHHPLLLGPVRQTTTQVFKGFRFLEAWFLHPEFHSKVEELWTQAPGDLRHKLEHFKHHI